MKRLSTAAKRSPVEFVIDEEIEALIPHLSPEELAQLEQNILAEGCREKLIVWDDGRQKRLLDGHNRFAICTSHKLPFEVDVIALPNREAAIGWVLRHQLGRRNLSPEAMSYLRGRMYLGAKRQGARTDLTSGHDVQKSTTAEQLAAEYKVDEKTIRRDARFAEEIDELAAAHGVQIKNEVLARDARITRKDVKRLLALEASSRKQVIASIRKGAKASTVIRKLGCRDDKSARRERKRARETHGDADTALKLIEQAAEILKRMRPGSTSAGVLDRIDAQIAALRKDVEVHRPALQRSSGPRVDMLAAAQAIFELESKGILRVPTTAIDAFFANPGDPKALQKQLSEVRGRIRTREEGTARGSNPANDVMGTDHGRPLSYKTFSTIQRYLDVRAPQLEPIYNKCAATRQENHVHEWICARIDRYLENGGGMFVSDTYSYADYLQDHCADPQVYDDALQAMGSEMLAHLRALNRFSGDERQYMQRTSRQLSQGSATAAVPASGSPMRQDVPVIAPSQPTVPSMTSAHVQPDSPRELPTREEIEQEVSRLIDDLQCGRVKPAFRAEQMIRQKNWPDADKNTALALFFAARRQLPTSARTAGPSGPPQSDSAVTGV